MPSPLGHAMAGAMTAWIAETIQNRSDPQPVPLAGPSLVDRLASVVTPLAVTCAVVAVSPDFDVFFHTHRTYSHSLGAAGLVWIVAALVAWRLRLPVVKIATVCAAAYGSHILLDWLGRDDSMNGGLLALWPFSGDFYRSGLNLFLEIEGHPRAIVNYPGRGLVWMIFLNREALAREVLIVGPPFLVVLGLRLKRWKRGLGPQTGQTSTYRTLSRSSGRVVRPRRVGAAAGRAGTSDHPAPRAALRGSPGTRRVQ